MLCGFSPDSASFLGDGARRPETAAGRVLPQGARKILGSRFSPGNDRSSLLREVAIISARISARIERKLERKNTLGSRVSFLGRSWPEDGTFATLRGRFVSPLLRRHFHPREETYRASIAPRPFRSLSRETFVTSTPIKLGGGWGGGGYQLRARSPPAGYTGRFLMDLFFAGR